MRFGKLTRTSRTAALWAILSLPPQLACAQAVVSVPEEIQKQLAAIPQPPAPAIPVRLLTFSLSTGSTSHKYYERLDNGLWGIVEQIPQSRNLNMGQSIAFHGLFELVSVMDVLSQMTVMVPVPAGKRFLAPEIATGNQTTLTRNTSTVGGDLERVANPGADQSFSYTLAGDRQLVLASAFRKMQQTFKYETSSTCKTGALTEANLLHPALKGKYLPVKCDTTETNGPGFARSFAYLIDSRLYVLLENTSAGNTETYTLSGVEY